MMNESFVSSSNAEWITMIDAMMYINASMIGIVLIQPNLRFVAFAPLDDESITSILDEATSRVSFGGSQAEAAQ